MQDQMDSTNSSIEESTPLVANGSRSRNDRPGIPQLFTSVPAFNEAASYLAETTSIFSRCFTDLEQVQPFWVTQTKTQYDREQPHNTSNSSLKKQSS